MRPLLAALLLAACGAPTSSASDDASTTDATGWAAHGTNVQRPEDCQAGLLVCRRRRVPSDPSSDTGASLFCVRPDNSVHCGGCWTNCPSLTCSRSDAGTYACAP